MLSWNSFEHRMVDKLNENKAKLISVSKCPRVTMSCCFFQPDELYFEEGDILYISDTVGKSWDFSAAFLTSLTLQLFFLFNVNPATSACFFLSLLHVIHPFSDNMLHLDFTSHFHFLCALKFALFILLVKMNVYFRATLIGGRGHVEGGQD